MEHDRHAVPLHGNDQIGKLAFRGRRELGKVESRAGEEEFPEPAGVREVGADRPAVDKALNNEAVGSGSESGGNDVLEELHVGIITKAKKIAILEKGCVQILS
jgi:hypothetical protein